jgi:hypothetical protein
MEIASYTFLKIPFILTFRFHIVTLTVAKCFVATPQSMDKTFATTDNKVSK